MNGRIVLALLFLVGGASLALAGAQPEAALHPSQAGDHEGETVRVKGVVESVAREDHRFTLADQEASLRVEMGSIPTAVIAEKSLLAEGELVREQGELVLRAEEIQMGCPSKYEA